MKTKSYLKNITVLLVELETKSKKITNKYDNEKDYMKIQFRSDDDSPLNKQLKFHNGIVTIRCFWWRW